MDFRLNSQPGANPAPAVTPASSTEAPKHSKKDKGDGDVNKWFRSLSVVVLFGAAVLILAIAMAFARGNNSGNEFKLVNNKSYQAVFLNNGQVYFGKISSLNSKYVDLTGIYYLTQNTTTNASGQTVTNGDYTLIKLGCQQIHYPNDQMVINRDQVSFWENLNDKGQVAQKIAEFKKNYPNGPDCTQVSSQTQSSNSASTNTQNTSNATTTNNSTKK